jgi:REP element-mobilizing transposase RayT
VTWIGENLWGLLALVLWGRRCRLPKVPMREYRRRLPHIHPNGAYLFLTWRLWGSFDRSASGPRWLLEPRIAEIVSHAILVGECERRFYQLCAWAVMPNHVHLLILPLVPVPVLMRWLKGSTARGANLILGRTGKPFWQDESYDHYLRESVGRTVTYIEGNPVSAGLVASAELWPWSSAGWGKMTGGTACPTAPEGPQTPQTLPRSTGV